MKLRVALIPVAGLIVLAGWCMYTLVDRSADPGHYYKYYRDPSRFVFPTSAVLGWCTAIAVEAAVACFALWRSPKPAAICVVVGVCFGSAFLALMPLAMHSPPYYGMHLFWLLLAAGWLLVAAIITAIVRGVKGVSVREHRVESVDERD